ncbi:MAG TPA: CPBP family intramembrane glutamic endopeptidase [Verrucomicrobiae bacterium]|nr:CPBP family intramembrane glutamic endopeptidase [Verrucomicrobiae bacterium]
MHFPFNFFIQFLAAAATGPESLSEAQLIARYPVLGVATFVLLVVGLLCDLYLLLRVVRPALSDSPSAGGTPSLQIDAKPWNMRDLLVSSALVALLLVGEITVALIFQVAHRDVEDALPWLLAMDMALRVAVLFGFVAFFRQRGIDWRRAIGLRRVAPARAIGFGATCFLAVLPPVFVVIAGYSQFCRLVGIREETQDIVASLATSDSMAVVVLIAVFAVVVAPVFEEFLFRGFAYPVLKRRWGALTALMVVSVAFAAIHFDLSSLAPLFALAVGLGLAYELTGSLLTPITMHALFNTANVAMILYVRAHS